MLKLLKKIGSGFVGAVGGLITGAIAGLVVPQWFLFLSAWGGRIDNDVWFYQKMSAFVVSLCSIPILVPYQAFRGLVHGLLNGAKAGWTYPGNLCKEFKNDRLFEKVEDINESFYYLTNTEVESLQEFMKADQNVKEKFEQGLLIYKKYIQTLPVQKYNADKNAFAADSKQPIQTPVLAIVEVNGQPMTCVFERAELLEQLNLYRSNKGFLQMLKNIFSTSVPLSATIQLVNETNKVVTGKVKKVSGINYDSVYSNEYNLPKMDDNGRAGCGFAVLTDFIRLARNYLGSEKQRKDILTMNTQLHANLGIRQGSTSPLGSANAQINGKPSETTRLLTPEQKVTAVADPRSPASKIRARASSF